MKNVSPALLALLKTRKFYRASLYTFNLVGGGTLRYCSGDRSITKDGNVYSAGGSTGPLFEVGERPTFTQKAGLEVDTYSFTVSPGSATIGGASFFNAVRYGLFDGADVTVERAYMPTYGDISAGTVIVFSGRVSEVSPAGHSEFTFNLSAWTELLNMNWPHNLFQSGCIRTLGDAGCGVNLDALSVDGIVQVGSSTNLILASIPQATGYFSYGKIAFTSGLNSGFSRGVRTYTFGTPSGVVLMVPLPSAPQAGDTFTIYPGCDKSIATCNARFQNLDNFAGTPFVPENSSAV